jgi:tetratricopeptide (TPR) repeat protein
MKLINLITLVSSIYRVFGNVNENASIEDLLEMGDINVGKDDPQSAIEYYEKGIEKMNENDSLLTALSLYTNLGKTYVSVENKPKAVIMYRKAIMLHSKNIDKIVAKSFKKEATDLAAQASFFLGTVLEGFEMFDEASDAYFYANSLDKNHWASLANRGSILLNHLKKTAEALGAYYNAFDILAHKDGKATDAPENLEEVLSQLQYKIGSAIIFSGTKTCTTLKDATKEIPCSDIAADAFNYAIELDPNNEQAKHMVASVTGDETMERASITYVTKLFEEYAGK